MIIDSHAHVGSSWLGQFQNTISPERMLEIYGEFGVSKACISSWAVTYDMEQANAEVAEICRNHPEYIPYVVISPLDGEAALTMLRKYIEDCGFKGVKMHPTANHYPADQLSMMEPFMNQIAEYGVPVMFHGDNDAYGNPGQFKTLAGAFPEVNVIVAHMCAGAWIAAIEACRTTPNLYLDTAYTLQENYILARAIERCGADKIIFGSDSPCTNILAHIDRVTTLNSYFPGLLSEEDTEKIMSGNILKLLGMDPA